MSFTSPSVASCPTSTTPAGVTLTPAGPPTTRNEGLAPSPQPRASITLPRNENDSPGRMSLRDGLTSSRAGGPGVRHTAFGALLVSALAVGAAPAGVIGRKKRVRRTLAVQFWP